MTDQLLLLHAQDVRPGDQVPHGEEWTLVRRVEISINLVRITTGEAGVLTHTRTTDVSVLRDDDF